MPELAPRIVRTDTPDGPCAQLCGRWGAAELGSRAALMTGKLRLHGNMVKALSLSAVVDRMNKVLATIPTEY